MNDYKFGNFLCALRESKELTQAELAQILSVTPAAISKWENGESKPRLETLFKLADIFEVTAEELMAGEFNENKQDKTDDENTKRYQYLARIESLLPTKVRILRACAFVIDWNIMALPMMICVLIIFFSYPMQGVSPSDGDFFKIIVIMLIMVFVWICGVVLRDLIFKGRSLGKRILGLTIIDRRNGDAPLKRQLVLRNLFFFLSNIDGIIILIRGISIGDSISQTLVVSKKQLEESEADFTAEISDINGHVSAKKEKKKVLLFLACGVVVYFVIAIVMHSFVFQFKKSEPYKVAYNYLAESESFKELNVDEEKIKWRSISGEGIINKSDTNDVTFSVEGKEYEIISHRENGVWIVCEDCTKFR